MWKSNLLIATVIGAVSASASAASPPAKPAKPVQRPAHTPSSMHMPSNPAPKHTPSYPVPPTRVHTPMSVPVNPPRLRSPIPFVPYPVPVPSSRGIAYPADAGAAPRYSPAAVPPSSRLAAQDPIPVVPVASSRGKAPAEAKVTALADLAPEQIRGAQVLIDSGKLSPEAAAALGNGIAGEPLTDDERDTLRNELENNPNLSTQDRARINEVLQNDASEKRKAALTNAIAGLIQQLAAGGGGGGSPAPAPEIPAIPPEIAGAIPSLPAASSPSPGTIGPAPDPAPEVGLLVLGAVEGSPAAKADLRANDILYSVNSKRMETYDDLPAAIKGVAGPVEVVFWNAETQRYESLKVTPKGGVLGVKVDENPAVLPRPAK